MAPPVAIQDAFGTIKQNNNPDGLVEFCESRLGTFPYWLDLDRESARGFALMGAAGAPLRQKVIEHALYFHPKTAEHRAPGVFGWHALCRRSHPPMAGQHVAGPNAKPGAAPPLTAPAKHNNKPKPPWPPGTPTKPWRRIKP